MMKLIVTNYDRSDKPKTVLLDYAGEANVNLALFNNLKETFKEEIITELPEEHDVISINIIESSADSSLPRLQTFMLRGDKKEQLLDLVDEQLESL
ncbi:hypothetical protein [Shouchella shacheensis]|uniref:hypothetical protein n=1 Tax=Shouchella shacheensis TaxID=1649580 RepID=UPI00073FE270|nr:hypothetical protein [Shouchella shacheensis]